MSNGMTDELYCTACGNRFVRGIGCGCAPRRSTGYPSETMYTAAVVERTERLAAAEGAKSTNPKDVVGSGKLPLELVPDTAVALESLAFLEGALKYGRFNWRIAGVRASIYMAAARRHMSSWWNGEDEDPKTGVHHLASARACLGIIIDARACGKLTDDRPPVADVGDYIRGLEAEVKRLKELFKDEDPYQYTISDSYEEAQLVPD